MSKFKIFNVIWKKNKFLPSQEKLIHFLLNFKKSSKISYLTTLLFSTIPANRKIVLSYENFTKEAFFYWNRPTILFIFFPPHSTDNVCNISISIHKYIYMYYSIWILFFCYLLDIRESLGAYYVLRSNVVVLWFSERGGCVHTRFYFSHTVAYKTCNNTIIMRFARIIFYVLHYRHKVYIIIFFSLWNTSRIACDL